MGGWEARRARVQRGVHRAFQVSAVYDDGGGNQQPLWVNVRRIPSTVGEGDEIEMGDDIIEIDLPIGSVPEPRRNATVWVEAEGTSFRIERVLRKSRIAVTVEAA